MTDKSRLLVNRIAALLAGGLVVFAVMSATVVSDANARNEELSEQLDSSRFEAGRLLAAAQTHLETGEYEEARESLAALFENQPGTSEATEGRALLAEVESAQSSSNTNWEEALPRIRSEWTAAFAADLRAASDAARAELEANMEETVSEAWEEAKEDVRAEWQAEQQS